MAPRNASWPLSSIILAAAGLALVGTGLYFLLLRPPLLPEDIRFMHLPAAVLDSARPGLEPWLKRVFWVMGGYVLAAGILIVTLAATSFRAGSSAAAIGVLLGGTASIAWMAAINFVIDSDFKWALLAISLLWVFSLILFLCEKRNHGCTDRLRLNLL